MKMKSEDSEERRKTDQNWKCSSANWMALRSLAGHWHAAVEHASYIHCANGPLTLRARSGLIKNMLLSKWITDFFFSSIHSHFVRALCMLSFPKIPLILFVLFSSTSHLNNKYGKIVVAITAHCGAAKLTKKNQKKIDKKRLLWPMVGSIRVHVQVKRYRYEYCWLSARARCQGLRGWADK